jgi:hypothetical protein
MNEYGTEEEWYWQVETEERAENPVSLQLCLLQIPHEMLEI